ncbi:HoxN/HupN/NixA family nickel/cobalt transporter [Robbsia sp. KACC 23696]|uniref:HoxN/HupN/NixA family nickel/cobalt transporter n=1 Tax=Robbsia sp. KACC 23696 TaxID=3149231 RepID=UPI00325BEB71
MSPDGAFRRKVCGVYLLLVGGNIAAWLWAVAAFHAHPLLLTTSALAYAFGLRHAVDADHIAAIDNVTRKLMQDGSRPATVGLMFSLGHSTIVVLASALIALTIHAMRGAFFDDVRVAYWRDIGGAVGTTVSAIFLIVIALMNLVILRSVWRAFRRARRGLPYREAEIDEVLAGRGLLARLLRPAFRLVTRSWHMYPLGFLFGLGFDTATEVGLLGLSANGATQGLSTWSIMVFPALFLAGMTLVDTTDGLLMVRAYGWAFVRPIRKLYYNLTVTALSVAVALFIGGIEAMSLIGDKLGLKGRFWDAMASLGDHLGMLGYATVALFVGGWLLSMLVYRWCGYAKLDRLGAGGAESD